MLRLILITFVFIFTCSSLWASDRYSFKDSTKYVLLLTNTIDDIKIYIHTGDKIKFKYNRHQYKGTLDSISEQTFYVGGNEYRLDKLQNIKIFKQKNTLKKTGLFLCFLCCPILIIAGILFLLAKIHGLWNDEESNLTFGFYGLLLLAGNSMFLAGLFFFLGSLYRYYFGKYRKIESVPEIKE